MKRKYADARNCENILKSRFKNFHINDKYIKGNVSILNILEVENRWIVDVEERCILDNGYKWLEIYPDEENYCITAMCDENDSIKEWYIDITKYNGIEDDVPYIEDLYLDIVIVPDGRVHVLDEDELFEAYNNKIISKCDYKLAYKIKDIIFEKYVNNIEYLKQITEKYIKYS